MLNEVHNNNDVMHVANMVLNEVPNSNNTMHVGNNGRLTAVGAQQFPMVAICDATLKNVHSSSIQFFNFDDS